jgi:hypothetical protein
VSLGHGFVTFGGGPEGGSVAVNDSYQFATSNGANNDSGEQTAGGPTLGFPAAANGGISFYPAQFGCRYGVMFSFAIATRQIGDWPYGPGDTHPDGEAIGLIYTPERPIPANLQLSGTATVGWEADPSAGNGSYRATVTGNSAWAHEYTTLARASGMAPGTATISWNFSRGTGPPTSCSLGGGTTASAASDPLARTAQQTCQPPVDQKKLAAKKAARIEVYAFTALAGLSGLLAAASAPSVVGGVFWATGVAVFGVFAAHAGLVVGDPPNVNWRSIARARLIGPLRAPSAGFLRPASRAAFDAILHEMATVNGLEDAFYVSHNRETSATVAHNSVWINRQTAAMGRFAVQAARAINQLVTSIEQSKSTLSTPFPRLTAANLQHAAQYVHAHGLPTSLAKLARKDGLSAGILAAIERRIVPGKPLPYYAASIYGILSNPSLINAARAEADALLAYGQLLAAQR